MRITQIDWQRVLAQLRRWDALPDGLRAEWIRMQPSDLFKLPPGGGADPLIVGGWLTRARIGRYEVARRHRYFHRALRACSRVPVFDGYGSSDRKPLLAYLREHFSQRDYATLGREGAGTDRAALAAEMTREEWLGNFLRWQGRSGGGTADARTERWRRASPTAVVAARGVIQALIDHGAPLGLAEMLDVVDRASGRSEFALGLAFACREALLLVALNDTALPFVGVWPARSATRGTGTARAVQFDRARPLLCRPVLIHDVATLLVEATAAPPRLKADGAELFARARDGIGAALTALPEWVKSDEGPLARWTRVDTAAYVTVHLGLAAPVGRPGKDLSLAVTASGRRWLALDARARLKQVLDVCRDDEASVAWSPEDGPFEYGASFDDETDDDVAMDHGLGFLPYDPGLEYSWVHGIDCRAAITAAYLSVADAAAVSLTDFVRRYCRERNPLSRIAFMPYADEEIIARQWELAVLTFFYRRMVAFGAVEFGPLTDGQLGFRITPVGRYLLAETDQMELEAPEETGDALVQPNFEIVFLAPSLDAQLRARAYAEPTAALEGADSVGTLFVLRRESVQRAVMAGQDADAIVESLRELSKHPLPDNVERQVTAWATEVRWIDVRPAVVVDCGDAETAARVLTVVGKGGRQLSATAVELRDGTRLTPAMRKKLTATGIFVR